MNTGQLHRVWNRAALEGGGPKPRIGDRALAAALKVHSLVMNGGVHHAMEALSKPEFDAASAGFEYLGLVRVAEMLRRVRSDPQLREWSDDAEEEANRQYWSVLPDDAELVVFFERQFRSKPADFGPTDEPA